MKEKITPADSVRASTLAEKRKIRHSQITTLFFILLLAFVGYQFFRLLMLFAGAIFPAGIIAFGFFPLCRWLRTRLKSNFWAALVMTIFVLLCIVPLLCYIIWNLVDEGVRFYNHLYTLIQDDYFNDLIVRFRDVSLVQRIEALYPDMAAEGYVADWIKKSVSAFGSNMATHAAGITKNIFMVIVNVFLAVFLIFIFFKDGPNIYRFLHKITPLEPKNKDEIYKEVTETFQAVIRGQVLSACIQSTLMGFVFLFMGLPFPALCAFLTFFLAFIPLAGAPIVWVPFAVYLVLQGAYIKAGILAFLGVAVIGMVDNVIHPLVLGKQSQLPYALLLLGILGGISIYGFVGIFIGPVVISLFFVLIRIYRRRFSEKAEVGKDPLPART